MTATIAYFVDGPLHGAHAELERPLPEWNVVKPRDAHDLLTRRWSEDDRDPALYITITTGTYARAETPVLDNARVNVWRYTWKGWQ